MRIVVVRFFLTNSSGDVTIETIVSDHLFSLVRDMRAFITERRTYLWISLSLGHLKKRKKLSFS